LATARTRRLGAAGDAAFLSLLYATGLRQAAAVELDLADPRSQQRVLLRDLDLRVSETRRLPRAAGTCQEQPIHGFIDPNAEPGGR
jgi:site-specific recombinase XerD